MEIVNLVSGAAGGDHNNAVSKWMRAGEWHVVAASGWVPLEPERQGQSGASLSAAM